MDYIAWVYKENGHIWIGVEKEKPPKWTEQIPDNTYGFVKIVNENVDWYDPSPTEQKNVLR